MSKPGNKVVLSSLPPYIPSTNKSYLPHLKIYFHSESPSLSLLSISLFSTAPPPPPHTRAKDILNTMARVWLLESKTGHMSLPVQCLQRFPSISSDLIHPTSLTFATFPALSAAAAPASLLFLQHTRYIPTSRLLSRTFFHHYPNFKVCILTLFKSPIIWE